jgi:hypothetical protein
MSDPVNPAGAPHTTDDGCCGGGVGPVPYALCKDCPRRSQTTHDRLLRLRIGRISFSRPLTVSGLNIILWGASVLAGYPQVGFGVSLGCIVSLVIFGLENRP